jgi:hypothetical protein
VVDCFTKILEISFHPNLYQKKFEIIFLEKILWKTLWKRFMRMDLMRKTQIVKLVRIKLNPKKVVFFGSQFGC